MTCLWKPVRSILPVGPAFACVFPMNSAQKNYVEYALSSSQYHLRLPFLQAGLPLLGTILPHGFPTTHLRLLQYGCIWNRSNCSTLLELIARYQCLLGGRSRCCRGWPCGGAKPALGLRGSGVKVIVSWWWLRVTVEFKRVTEANLVIQHLRTLFREFCLMWALCCPFVRGRSECCLWIKDIAISQIIPKSCTETYTGISGNMLCIVSTCNYNASISQEFESLR